MTQQYNPIKDTRITLKSLKTWSSMDGGGFSVRVFLDGTEVATFENDGSGGPVYWHKVVSSKEKLNELFAYAKSFAPLHFQGEDLEYNIEMLLDEMITLQELRASLKRRCKAAFIYADESCAYGDIMLIKCDSAAKVQGIIDALDAKKGKGKWLMLANPRDGVAVDPAYFKPND